MSKYLILSILWILLFSWDNGFGLNIEWWVFVLMMILWLFYMKLNKFGYVALFFLFFLNLYINHLFNFDKLGFNFNWEKINLTNPGYLQLIDKYRLADVGMMYTLRMIFYQKWLMVFLWIDSVFKILSPVFFVKVLGFGGATVWLLGLVRTPKRCWWWVLTVVASSGLGISIDTKTAIVLALPAMVLIMSNGFQNMFFRKYWWVLVILLVVDLILK